MGRGQRTAGGTCADGSWCLSGACAGGTCAECADGSGCTSGLCIEGACAEKRGLGEACADASWCLSAVCIEGACAEKRGLAGACADASWCLSGACVGSVCRDPTGAACNSSAPTFSSDHALASCSEWRNAPMTDVGHGVMSRLLPADSSFPAFDEDTATLAFVSDGAVHVWRLDLGLERVIDLASATEQGEVSDGEPSLFMAGGWLGTVLHYTCLPRADGRPGDVFGVTPDRGLGHVHRLARARHGYHHTRSVFAPDRQDGHPPRCW